MRGPFNSRLEAGRRPKVTYLLLVDTSDVRNDNRGCSSNTSVHIFQSKLEGHDKIIYLDSEPNVSIDIIFDTEMIFH